MSEHGWKEFLGAEGVDYWVVMHGGACGRRSDRRRLRSTPLVDPRRSRRESRLCGCLAGWSCTATGSERMTVFVIDAHAAIEPRLWRAMEPTHKPEGRPRERP